MALIATARPMAIVAVSGANELIVSDMALLRAMILPLKSMLVRPDVIAERGLQRCNAAQRGCVACNGCAMCCNGFARKVSAPRGVAGVARGAGMESPQRGFVKKCFRARKFGITGQGAKPGPIYANA